MICDELMTKLVEEFELNGEDMIARNSFCEEISRNSSATLKIMVTTMMMCDSLYKDKETYARCRWCKKRGVDICWDYGHFSSKVHKAKECYMVNGMEKHILEIGRSLFEWEEL